jgi:hypothetical protein
MHLILLTKNRNELLLSKLKSNKIVHHSFIPLTFTNVRSKKYDIIRLIDTREKTREKTEGDSRRIFSSFPERSEVQTEGDSRRIFSSFPERSEGQTSSHKCYSCS